MTSRATVSREQLVATLERLAQLGVPAPGAAHVLDVGSDEFLDYFEAEVLDQLVCRGGATCKIFEGVYGSGKTHLLQLLHDMALAKGMAVVRTDLSEAISLENWSLVTEHILQHLTVLTPDGSATSLPRALEALARAGRIDPSRLQGATLPHPGFARAITLACDPHLRLGRRSLIHRFLQGERVSVSQLKAEGVTGVKHPLSARNAELVIKTVFAALFQLGVPGTVLLFDENERTFASNGRTPPRRVVLGANLLRRLIDASATGALVGTVAVFAVLPDFLENCRHAYAALGQRLHVDRGARTVGWRSPVLPLDLVSSGQEPEEFLEGLVDRIEELLRACGVSLNGQRHTLAEAGRQVLERNAGSGYRRPLVKQIATMSLRHL